MASRNYPIIIGHKEPADKGMVACIQDDTAKVCIVRLKEPRAAGTNFDDDNIQNVIAELWFCRKESLEICIKTLQSLLDLWKEDAE